MLFTITANADQYAAKLTDGHKALLAQYPDTYKMPFTRLAAAAVPKFREDAVEIRPSMSN